MLLGTYFFGIIGAFFRWLFHIIYCKATNKEIKSFKKIWLGHDDENPENEAAVEMFNNILGMIIVFIAGMLVLNVRL